MDVTQAGFLENPWVIGIGGGVLSGLIVTFVSRALLSRRDNREYAQKLIGANREVLYAVRPGISEGSAPSLEILTLLIEATARKYGVDHKDMYRPHEIAQELVKEVMDSSFLSSTTKEEYCAQLSNLAKPDSTTEHSGSKNDSSMPRPSIGIDEYRSRMVGMMSIMMGILAASMTMLISFREGPFSILFRDSRFGFDAILLPVLLVSVIVLSTTFLSSVTRRRRKFDDRNRHKPENPKPSADDS